MPESKSAGPRGSNPGRMRAAWYEETGPAPEVIRVGRMERPRPGPGEVLVRLRTSGVNPSDTKRRAGWLGLEMDFPRVVPHSDGAGTVVAVGPGVPETRKGERVWTWNARGPGRAFGTAAEMVALPSEQAPRLPDGVSWAEGACLGVPATTAHFAVFADGPVRDRTLLVAGGAGAVGHYAVQFAAWGGAEVVATVSSERKAEHARAAGADHVILYPEEDVARRVHELTEGIGADRIVEVDFAANVGVDAEAVRPGGTIASYSSTSDPEPVLPYYDLAAKGITIRLVQGYRMPPAARRAAVDAIRRLLSAGRLHNRVAARFPLERTAEAHELAESGEATGTVVVEVTA